MAAVRRAVVADTPELVRLRATMLAAMSATELDSVSWQESTAETLRTHLTEPDGDWAAFVVDAPAQPGRLAACSVGIVERLLGSPQNPDGKTGYVLSVATDPEHRRRGYSRACMQALLDWFDQRGIAEVDLNSSEAAESLYRSLGFALSPEPAMRRRLPRDHR